jgi:hypothetical protein
MKKRSIYLILSLVVFAAFISLNGCKSSKKMAGATKPSEKTETATKPAETPETKPEEKPAVEVSMSQKLENYFNAIANSSSIQSANANISETMTMFESADVPVIISFYRENGVKDYDEPTTISKYLNYLKDQKKNPNKVENAITNDDGKIVELDLIKR